MPALQKFFEAERLRRGWTMRQVAPRAKISLSKAYAIANGDDNVEFETFENIAAAFDMTPAELATAIGKGGELAPDEAQVLATYRRVPAEKRPAAQDMLHGLAVQPVPPVTAKRRVTKRDDSFGRPKIDEAGSFVVQDAHQNHYSLSSLLGLLKMARVPA